MYEIDAYLEVSCVVVPRLHCVEQYSPDSINVYQNIPISCMKFVFMAC